MLQLFASKIRRPSRPSIATNTKSFRLADEQGPGCRTLTNFARRAAHSSTYCCLAIRLTVARLFPMMMTKCGLWTGPDVKRPTIHGADG
jgi:hypothetical protein